MALTIKELEEEALRLSASEREKLATNLFQSTHNKEVSEIDDKWLCLAQERYEALLSGKDSGISAEAFFEQVEEKLGWK